VTPRFLAGSPSDRTNKRRPLCYFFPPFNGCRCRLLLSLPSRRPGPLVCLFYQDGSRTDVLLAACHIRGMVSLLSPIFFCGVSRPVSFVCPASIHDMIPARWIDLELRESLTLLADVPSAHVDWFVSLTVSSASELANRAHLIPLGCFLLELSLKSCDVLERRVSTSSESHADQLLFLDSTVYDRIMQQAGVLGDPRIIPKLLFCPFFSLFLRVLLLRHIRLFCPPFYPYVIYTR